MTAMQVLWAGAMLFAGWLFMYLFGRQFLFNFTVAYPLIKKMNTGSSELISPNAKKYTLVSVISTGIITLLGLILILFIKKVYLKISFYAGVIICAAMIFSQVKVTKRNMFEAFCATYYRFIFDDELRTHMYNKKVSGMKIRLHDMGLSTDWIPKFEKED